MRVAASVRVSTDEQAEKGNSLKEQQERLKAYCKVMGWDAPTFYIDDGYSAGDLNRPQLRKLLKEIEKGKYDILITTKLDRFTRNLFDLLKLLKFLEKHNCDYVSATESFDTSTAAGRMVLQILGVFAEFERARTSERVSDNMDSLAENTDKALSRPCFGLDVVDKKFEINKNESKYLLKMVEMFEGGRGARMIAKTINDMGILTKQGNMWDAISVKRILQTESIAGIRVRNKTKKVGGKVVLRPKEEWSIKKDNHPANIDPDRFWRMQGIFESRASNRKFAESETYLLSGVLRCGHCGKKMKGSTSRNKRPNKTYTYHRYICSSYLLNYSCERRLVNRDDLESEVLEMIKKIARTSTADLDIKVANKTSQEELRETEQQLTRLSHQIQRQIEAHGKGLIEDEDLKLASGRVKEERKILRTKLEMLNNENGNVESVKSNIEDLLGDITSIDRQKAKSGIFKLIESMEFKVGNVDVVWRA